MLLTHVILVFLELGDGAEIMLLTHVILAFPELGDGAEILADVTETGAQGVAGG